MAKSATLCKPKKIRTPRTTRAAAGAGAARRSRKSSASVHIRAASTSEPAAEAEVNRVRVIENGGLVLDADRCGEDAVKRKSDVGRHPPRMKGSLQTFVTIARPAAVGVQVHSCADGVQRCRGDRAHFE